MIAIIGGCSSNNKKNNTNSDLEKQSKINIEDINWKVRQGIVEGDRYALLDYTNNTPYTITHFELTFEEKDDLKEEDKEMALEYIGNRFTPEADIHWDYIRLAMRSVADTCIIPVQDYLGLGCEARINTPSTLGGNWIWRSDADSFTDNLAAKIKKITQLCARSLQQKGE